MHIQACGMCASWWDKWADRRLPVNGTAPCFSRQYTLHNMKTRVITYTLHWQTHGCAHELTHYCRVHVLYCLYRTGDNGLLGKVLSFSIQPSLSRECHSILASSHTLALAPLSWDSNRMVGMGRWTLQPCTRTRTQTHINTHTHTHTRMYVHVNTLCVCTQLLLVSGPCAITPDGPHWQWWTQTYCQYSLVNQTPPVCRPFIPDVTRGWTVWRNGYKWPTDWWVMVHES